MNNNNEKILQKLYRKQDEFKKACDESIKTNPQDGNYVKFIQTLFPNKPNAVKQMIEDYEIVGFSDGKTAFLRKDADGQVRAGTISDFDSVTGREIRSVSFPDDISLKIEHDKKFIFGENLLEKYPNKLTAIVESEKTAILASVSMPRWNWLALGQITNLLDMDLNRFKDRGMILFPDGAQFFQWREISENLSIKGIKVSVSNQYVYEPFEEMNLQEALIKEQRSRMLRKVLDDKKLFNQLNTHLQEIISKIEQDWEVIREDAEYEIIRPEIIDEVVSSILN